MIKEVLDKVDFIELVSQRVVLHKVSDTSYKGLSPFTNEKTPSFFINPKSKTWYDFSSGTGGGVIDYVVRTEGLDKSGALHFLADLVGVELKDNDPNSVIRAVVRESYKFFLDHADGAVEYMESRGFSKGTLSRYGVGFAPQGGKPLIDYLTGKGFSREDILASGVGYVDDNNVLRARYQNRVIFPIQDVYGSTVSFTGRRISTYGIEAKYLHGKTTPIFRKKNIVWNLSNVRSMVAAQNLIVVTEGQMDALALCDSDIPGVAILGSTPSENQVKLLSGVSKNIYFVFDSDEAGQEALLKAFQTAENIGSDSILYAVILPKGEDPQSFVSKHGGEAFRELLSHARSDTSVLITSLISKQLASGNKTRAQVVSGVINEVAPYVRNKLTYRGLDLVERLSQEFSLNRTELRTMIERKNSRRTPIFMEQIEEALFPAPIYERRLLYAMLDEPHLVAKYNSSGLTLIDFESELVSRIVEMVDPKLDSAEMFQKLQDNVEDEEYMKLLEFYSKGMPDVDFDSTLEVMRAAVNKRTRDKKNNFLGRPIPTTKSVNDKRRELKERLRMK